MEKTIRKTAVNSASKGLTKNVIQFRNGFVNLPSAKASNYTMAMTVAAELMQFGYILEQAAINNLSAASRENIVEFHNEVIVYLKHMTGSNRNFKALYSGFPTQVMEMSDAELWVNQIVHYLSNGRFIPNEWTKEKPTAFENSKYTKIVEGNEDKFLAIFTDLVSVNQSLTPDDLNIVKWFCENDVELRFPEQIPFKENLCTLASMGLDVPVKTVTDVLRIAVGMSGGDISLPKVPQKYVRTNRWSSRQELNPERDKFKFKSFSRSERKHILSLLEKTNCDAAEATLKAQRWVKLGHSLHVGEYAKKFPKAAKLFNSVRNENVQSWYGKVNEAFSNSFEEGVKLLSQRPGEFVRKLDWLLRTETFSANKKVKGNILSKYNTKKPHIADSFKKLTLDERVSLVLDVFKMIAPRVSNKVLYEVYNHFEGRYDEKTGRTIMIKGARKRTALPNLPAIDAKVIESVQRGVVEALLSKFAALPKLEKVYVDEQLKNIPMPTNMRSLNSSLKPTIRGLRMPIGNTDSKVIRVYVHWFDERGDKDIDLSTTFIGNNKQPIVIAYTNLRNEFTTHSGDVRHRRGACAEYIDIEVAKARKAGYKYATVDIRNFNGGSLASIKDCVFGFMEREFPESNKTFLPSTLANSMKLESSSTVTLAVIIDLETREYIYMDIDSSSLPVAAMSVKDTVAAIKPYTDAPKFSVYDLALLHAEARGGELVEKEEEANTVFKFEEYSQSYIEILKLMGV